MTSDERVEESIRLMNTMKTISQELAKKYPKFVGITPIGGFQFHAPGGGGRSNPNEIPDVEYKVFFSSPVPSQEVQEITRHINTHLADKGFRPCTTSNKLVFPYQHARDTFSGFRRLNFRPQHGITRDIDKYISLGNINYIFYNSVLNDIHDIFTSPIFGSPKRINRLKSNLLRAIKSGGYANDVLNELGIKEKIIADTAHQKWVRTKVIDNEWERVYKRIKPKMQTLHQTLEKRMKRFK